MGGGGGDGDGGDFYFSLSLLVLGSFCTYSSSAGQLCLISLPVLALHASGIRCVFASIVMVVLYLFGLGGSYSRAKKRVKLVRKKSLLKRLARRSCTLFGETVGGRAI